MIVKEGDFTGKVVSNYVSMANWAVGGQYAVNSGCTVAIEGCMDPTAVNYDSQANVNTGTWCVPSVQGCMMPSIEADGPAFHAIQTGLSTYNTRDGGAALKTTSIDATKGYNPLATVHVKSMCLAERLGCSTDPSARNYDPLATAPMGPGACFTTATGCLNPSAVNFCCAARQDTACDCLHTGVVVHYTKACKWPGEASDSQPLPPSPPPPGMPGGGGFEAIVTFVVQVSFTTAGTPAENKGESKMSSVVADYAAYVGLPLETTTAKVMDFFECLFATLHAGGRYEASTESCGAVRRLLGDFVRRLSEEGTKWVFETEYQDESSATAAKDSVASKDMSAAGLSSALSGVTVTSDATVTVEKKIVYKQTGLPDAVVMGIIVGVVIGVVLILGIVGFVLYKKRQKRMKLKTVIPA
jgi:hypothetical protein